MDAQYKELQSYAKKTTPNLDEDDMPMSREEEAKFMITFRKTHFYNDYRDRDSNRDNWCSSRRSDYNRDNYRSNTDDKPYDLQKQFNNFMKSQQSTNVFVKETFMDLKTQLKTVAKNHQSSIQNLEIKFNKLADKHSGRPFGSLPTENMLVKVGKFTLLADFVILEIEEDSKVPHIMGRPFIHTADAVIRVKQKQLNLGVGAERMIFNIDSAIKHSYSNDDTFFTMDSNENYDSESDEEELNLDENNHQHRLKNQDISSKNLLWSRNTNKPHPDNLNLECADSPWVSPIYYVPKKDGITVVINKNDELVPTRTVTGWQPNWNLPFELMCDASDFAVGAVLDDVYLGQKIEPFLINVTTDQQVDIMDQT
ncbi:hypothetical protein Tco_1409516 [Tanacetum coccineum]